MVRCVYAILVKHCVLFSLCCREACDFHAPCANALTARRRRRQCRHAAAVVVVIVVATKVSLFCKLLRSHGISTG